MTSKELQQKYAQKIICLVGPTATGKSELAIWLANNLNGEIINADATQFYQSMDIGTNKVTVTEQTQAIHHLLDIAKPDQDYSVADFQRDGRQLIKAIFAKNKLVIVVGGSGLYINALLCDYRFIDETALIKESQNQSIINDLSNLSNEALWDQLVKIDPPYSKTTHINNRQRVLRALKFYYLHNKTKSAHIAAHQRSELYDTTYIGLTFADKKAYQDYLYQRILDHTSSGLIEEVRSLYNKYGLIKNLKAISYKEMITFIDHKVSLKEAQIEILKNNIKLAKKQLTWFKGQIKSIKWFFNDYNIDFGNLIKEVENFLIKI